MIKFAFRRNLIYLFFLFIYYYLRKIISIVMNQVLKFNYSLIYTLLMVMGEFFGGLSIYIYQKNFLSQKITSKNRFAIKLISDKAKMNPIDGSVKIYILTFFAAFFDFVEYIMVSYFIPKLATLSPTSDQRLCFICTISCSIICTYTLRMNNGKHQIFSLIGMGICSGIILILEFIFQTKGNNFLNIFLAFVLIICHYFFVTFTDVIERYLVEFDFVNPQKLLATEGFFGIIMFSLYSITDNPFKDIKENIKTNNGWENFLLFFLLFLYFAFSAGVNVYKILCNVLYSPMAKALSSYTFNPFFLIYYFLNENDFKTDGEKNYFYFIINIVLSVLIDFFGLFYNEIFVLYCCGLEYETYHGIAQRSTVNATTELDDLKILNDSDNNADNDNDQIIEDIINTSY